MVKDTVSNLIVKIKNASLAGKASVVVPQSKLVHAILSLLEKEGFVASLSKHTDGKSIEVSLAYDESGAPKIGDVKRVSKLSRREYIGAKALRPVRSGFGISVLSTPKGILSDKEARKHNVGGEVLFKIW